MARGFICPNCIVPALDDYYGCEDSFVCTNCWMIYRHFGSTQLMITSLSNDVKAWNYLDWFTSGESAKIQYGRWMDLQGRDKEEWPEDLKLDLITQPYT